MLIVLIYSFVLIILRRSIFETSDRQNLDFEIDTIDGKLRQFGLSDKQIAEALDIPLEQVKQVDLEE
jgi:hypothetical protein